MDLRNWDGQGQTTHTHLLERDVDEKGEEDGGENRQEHLGEEAAFLEVFFAVRQP